MRGEVERRVDDHDLVARGQIAGALDQRLHLPVLPQHVRTRVDAVVGGGGREFGGIRESNGIRETEVLRQGAEGVGIREAAGVPDDVGALGGQLADAVDDGPAEEEPPVGGHGAVARNRERRVLATLPHRRIVAGGRVDLDEQHSLDAEQDRVAAHPGSLPGRPRTACVIVRG